MARAKKQKLSLEALLEQALVMEDEYPYEVPSNWVWVPLGVVGDYINGKAFKSIDWEDTGYPIIRIQNLTGTNTDFNYYNKEIEEKYKVKNGELLMAWSGTLDAFIWSGGNAVLNQHIFKINSFINKKFHYYMLKNLIQEMYLKTHGTGMVHITKTKFERLAIPLPSLAEQQRIVERIDSLFEKLDKAKELVEDALESFEKRKAAILHKAFTGELTANWREENKVNLDSWQERKLGELIEIGPQNGLYKAQSAYGQGDKIVRIDNFYEGYINEWHTLKTLTLTDQEKETYSLNNNDIIINRVNSIEYLGKSALVRNLNEICVFESNVMRLSLVSNVHPEYAIRYLNSERGLKELRKNAKHAVNQASINQTDVKNAIIVLPSIEEQLEVIKILDNLLSKEYQVQDLCYVIEKIDLMKKAILARAFRGELGTNNPEEESAIELLKEVLKEKL